MDTIEILTIILLILSSTLCIALIYYIYQFVKSVHSISAEIQGLSHRLNPLIKLAMELSEKLTRVTDEAESQLQTSKSVVGDIRDRVDKILNVESKIRVRIENTVIPLIRNFRALYKGIDSFWKNLKANRRNISVE